MDTYQSMTLSVLNYLSNNQYCSSLIKANERCFEKLCLYLENKKICYSPEAALEWYTQSNDLAPSDLNHGRIALQRLQDVAETGSIRIEHETKHLMSYAFLSSYMKERLETYLEHRKDNLAESTIENHRLSCAKFLAFVQKKGIHEIREINIALIVEFYNDAIYFGINNKPQVNSHVSSMMQYFYESGEVSYGCTVIMHYLIHGKIRGCFWNKISADAHLKINEYMKTSETVSLETLLRYKDLLVQLHCNNGYSKNVTTLNNRAVDLLILFLETYGYSYSPAIAMMWFEEVRSSFGKQGSTGGRFLCTSAKLDDKYRGTKYRGTVPMYKNNNRTRGRFLCTTIMKHGT